MLVCGAGKTLWIGEGAVIDAGCVITRSVPPGLLVSPASARPVARVKVPLSTARTMEEFWAGLAPLDVAAARPSVKPGPSEEQKPQAGVT